MTRDCVGVLVRVTVISSPNGRSVQARPDPPPLLNTHTHRHHLLDTLQAKAYTTTAMAIRLSSGLVTSDTITELMNLLDNQLSDSDT